MNIKNDTKYCVTALIDLLGFSKHLEISNDLRTKIGQYAIDRLDIIEEAIKRILEEEKEALEFFPKGISHQRINDALILTMDLSDFLMPSPGATFKNGLTLEEFSKDFEENIYESQEEFDNTYKKKIDDNAFPLHHFVGLVVRIHNFINLKEKENHFPGAKTVIASGFRKVFFTHDGKEDFLAANFSFTNAYIAEKHLHNAKLYIDCNLLQLLSNNLFARNLIKTSIYVAQNVPFNPFSQINDSLSTVSEHNESKIFQIKILHKNYHFRELDCYRCSCLQLIPNLDSYIEKNPEHKKPADIYGVIYAFITNKNLDIAEAKKAHYLLFNDISNDIKSIYQLLLFGRPKET